MDPADPSSFNHRKETLSTGRVYHFVDEKPSNYDASTLTILCVHGFPDIWYGWRHQIGPWVRMGYRVVAPDMLGYGGTDKPAAPRKYSTKRLCDDLAALLDILGVRKVILVGHDWGSYTSGRFALWHPDRLLALALLSIPYVPPVQHYLSLHEVIKRVPNYGYQLYFATDESTKEIEANLEGFLRLMYSLVIPDASFVTEGKVRDMVLHHREGKAPRDPALNEQELAYIASQMRSMHGPLSYYRTTKTRFEEEMAAKLPNNLRADLPVLHIWGSKDLTSSTSAAKQSKTYIPRLQLTEIEGVGHWVMTQAKEQVTDGVLQWLTGLGLVSGKTSQAKL